MGESLFRTAGACAEPMLIELVDNVPPIKASGIQWSAVRFPRKARLVRAF